MNKIFWIQETIQKLQIIQKQFVLSFFWNAIFLIPIYIVLVVITIAWLYYTNKIYRRVSSSLYSWLDQLRYECSRLLYTNKDSLYNFKNNLPLLLHYKTESIANPTLLKENSQKIIDEYLYINNLVWSIASIDTAQIQMNAKFLIKLENTKHRLSSFLSLFTVGLSRLFIS